MAEKPDGKQRNERITFTRPAAERIAKVVRHVEGGDRDSAGLTFRRVPPQAEGGKIKFAFYTATSNWFVVSTLGPTTTNNTKVIQFSFPIATESQGTNTITFSTGPTAQCVNHLAYLPLISTVATAANVVRTVLVMKEAGEWRLIGAQA